MAGEGARGGSAVRAFKLGGTGLERVLGELEASIMEAVWLADEASVQDVRDALGPEHNYKTVMTVMSRLADKGILSRRRVSKAFLYSAVEDRQAFLDRVSERVVDGLVRDFGATAIAQFVDAVNEVSPEDLALLQQLVRQKVEGGQKG
jgi:predicted transcriptional regulator